MTDRPILFSEPMVKALLVGQKTQTRRVLTRLRRFGKIRHFGHSETAGYDWKFRDSQARLHDLKNPSLLAALPFQKGDRLYVREAWRVSNEFDAVSARDLDQATRIHFVADNRMPDRLIDIDAMTGRLRPGMHMPRWASRLTLDVTGVTVERLQDISAEDARDEGVDRQSRKVRQMWLFGACADERARIYLQACKWEYEDLWNRINAERNDGAYAWANNPWVLAITFTVDHRNIDKAAP